MIGKKNSIATIKFNEEKLDTLVSSNITIEGKFRSTGNIRLDCTIVGEVDSESLFIGENCNIKGTVNCENIIIAGKIDGNVFCNGKMHIKETGIIDGDIVVNILSMDEGSMFTGNCTRKKSVEKQEEKDKDKLEKSEGKNFIKEKAK
ncbi:MAG TPA: cell shape determination protein CcmA [Clostridiales bacterium]|nr:cell shape determination protein CcmA [Clostridiales bacterium]